MNYFAHPLAILGLMTCIGCGSSSQTAETPSPAPAVTQTANIAPPTDVVRQFLDEVRRGGEDSSADQLLTNAARSELRRIGRVVQPIGSPDARYVVTRAETVPGEETSALVHSVWNEPNQQGTQVVWALQQEQAGWRISGLAMESAPNEDPIIVDFENGDLMLKILGPSEQPQIASGASTISNK